MSEVICVGILVADVVGKPVEEYPKRGQLVLVERLELHSGGCAANTGVALAKIGVKTSVVGKVGQDGFGDFLIGVLRQQGVDTRGIRRDPQELTSATMVMVHPDGERSFIHYIGANARLTLEDIDFDLVRQSRILHVAGAFLLPGLDGEPTAELLKRARSEGIITCLDTAWDSRGRWMSLLKPCLPYLDYMVPSFEEAKQLTGHSEPEAVAKTLLDGGVGTIALKMGENGCFVMNRETAFHVPVFQVPTMDALGAGDCFAAGFLAGLARGWDLETTARFANAVGALCVTALGATTGVKSLEETLEFIRAAGM